MTASELRAKADAIEAEAREVRKQASDAHQAELKSQELSDRLVYAAYSRCPCGAGLAYDPAAEGEGVFKGPDSWDCSAIILGIADRGRQHTAKLPFAFYEVKAEKQPSANGATTRPKKSL